MELQTKRDKKKLDIPKKDNTCTVEVMIGMLPGEQGEVKIKYAVNLCDSMEEVYAHIRDNLKRSAERQMQDYDAYTS